MDLIARLPETLRAALGADAVDMRGAAWAVRGVAPLCAVRPRDEEQVGIALRMLDEAGAATLLWGGGTQMEVGAVPARYDCALSLAGLARVLDHAPDDLTATVQAGATLADVQRALRGAGQRLAIDAPWAARSTLGGVHASGVVGPRTQDLGTVRTMVVGAEAYRADGTLVRAGGRVVKNVSGYDLHRVLFRSWGALAALTRLHVRLAALPERERVVRARFADAAVAFAAAERVRLARQRPVGVCVVRGLASLGAGTWLVAGWEGSAPDVDAAHDAARSAWDAAVHVEILEGDAAQAAWAAVAAPQLDDPVQATARVHLTVPASDALDLWAACDAHADVAAAGLLAYADRGVLVAHLRGDASHVAAACAALRATARDRGGDAVTVAASARTPDEVWGAPRSAAYHALAGRVKAAWDPRGRLAPGRLAGGL